MKGRYLKQLLFLLIVRSAALLIALSICLFFIFIFIQGYGVISWEFLTEAPRDMMTRGGIMPAILGTLYLTLGAVAVAMPLGVLAAVYLSEYAKEGRLLRFLRVGIRCLAGVPSVVFGLFGLGLFVVRFGFGSSILAGSLTLGFLILPTIIGASEEALKAVPQTFREASLGLGVSKWHTTTRIVLPNALPGVLTGAILSIGRAAGETAPIMFTAATFYSRRLPKSLSDEVMALPYHIYALMTEGTHAESQVPIAYGTALVLLLLVLLFSALAIFIRSSIRRKRQW